MQLCKLPPSHCSVGHLAAWEVVVHFYLDVSLCKQAADFPVHEGLDHALVPETVSQHAGSASACAPVLLSAAFHFSLYHH